MPTWNQKSLSESEIVHQLQESKNNVQRKELGGYCLKEKVTSFVFEEMVVPLKHIFARLFPLHDLMK